MATMRTSPPRGGDAPGDFVARELGHADVEEHDLGAEVAFRPERLLAIVGHAHRVAVRLEQHREAFRGVRVVVHYQHAPRGPRHVVHATPPLADLREQLFDLVSRLPDIVAREQVRMIQHMV